METQKPFVSFDAATRFVADIGPIITYYVVVDSVGKTSACFAAGSVGVIGSAMDYANSRMTLGRPWPRLLNSAEMLNYLGLGVLLTEDQHCKMWANFLQLAAITLAIVGGMFTVSERMDNDILRSESPEGDLRSASKQLRAAAREMAWVFVAAFTLMTGFALAPPLYRVIHGVPADDTFRSVFNLILPLSSLGLASLFLGLVVGPKWQAAKAAEENRSLVGGNNTTQNGDEKDHPATFGLLLLLALLPMAIVAMLAAVDDGNPDVCV